MAKYDASRNDTRYILTDTSKRAACDAVQAELDGHIAEFLAKGGKIIEVEHLMDSNRDEPPRPFTISYRKIPKPL